MKKISTLTRDQTQALTEYRDKWIQIGLCTEPANREEAESGIGLAYKIANKKPGNSCTPA